MDIFETNGHVVKYSIRRTADSNYIHMRFRPNLELEVFIPSKGRVDVERLLQKKRKWIERAYDEIAGARRIFDGKHVLYKGTRYKVHFTTRSKQAVNIQGNKLAIPLNKGEHQRDALKRWMTIQTLKVVRRRLSMCQLKYKFLLKDFTVKEMRRWAHCTKQGSLVFNLHLAALPPELIDYIVLHEISHLSEFNHSRRFKYTLAELYPDFREREAGLRKFVI